MHAQLITYRLDGISQDEAKADLLDALSTHFSRLDGLISKVWLTDEEANRFGGFYVWRDKKDFDLFMASTTASHIMSRPYIADLASQDWPVDLEASRSTRGVPA